MGGMAIVSQRKKHHLRVFFCFTASETPSVFFCFTALVISTGGSVSGTVLRAHNLHNKITFRVTESIKKAASHSTICHIALRGHAERASLTQTLDTANIHRQTFTGQTFTGQTLHILKCHAMEGWRYTVQGYKKNNEQSTDTPNSPLN